MMTMMTTQNIAALQIQYGYDKIQDRINTGLAWKLEGSVGRFAMDCLTAGACMLPEEDIHQDFYGNTVPNRNLVESGTKGSLLHCQNFWQKVEDGEIELDENSYDEE